GAIDLIKENKAKKEQEQEYVFFVSYKKSFSCEKDFFYQKKSLSKKATLYFKINSLQDQLKFDQLIIVSKT
ncbi:MAG: hypothetical protein Q4G18_07775, partial [Myroides sp.]|nr:hypothetical protein [Myroides sp.]